MSIAARAEREVVEFHEFIEDWLAGRIPDTDARYDRARTALADAFEIRSPSGETRNRERILADLRDGHGSAGEQFAIRVADVRTRFVFEADATCVVTYEEHQRHDPDDEWTRRYTTAVYRAAPDAPSGVEWMHLHETWRPGGEPGTD